MNPFTYTETELERDARLLTALGWTRLARVNTMQWYGIPPGADHNIPQACPRFHVDHNAKHTLLVWMSQQPTYIRDRFLIHLALATNYKAQAIGRAWADMTAMPDDVAIAADKALREAGAYKEGE